MVKKSEVYERLGYNISELYHYIRDSRIIEELNSASKFSREMENLRRDISDLHMKISNKKHLYHQSSNKAELYREIRYLQSTLKSKAKRYNLLRSHLRRAKITKRLSNFHKKFRKKARSALRFR